MSFLQKKIGLLPHLWPLLNTDLKAAGAKQPHGACNLMREVAIQ